MTHSENNEKALTFEELERELRGVHGPRPVLRSLWELEPLPFEPLPEFRWQGPYASIKALKPIHAGAIVYVDDMTMKPYVDSMQRVADAYRDLAINLVKLDAECRELYRCMYTPLQRASLWLHYYLMGKTPWLYARPASRRLRVWWWKAITEE